MNGQLASTVLTLDLPRAESRVLFVLCLHAQRVDGNEELQGEQSFPSIQRISWETGYDRRYVQRLLRRLEASCLIIWTAEYGPHGGWRIDLTKGPRKKPFFRWRGGRSDSRRGRSADRGQNVADFPGNSVFTAADGQGAAGGYTYQGGRSGVSPTIGTLTELSLLASNKSSFPSSSDDSLQTQFVEAVFKTLRELPSCFPRPTDRQIAAQLSKAGIRIEVIEVALWEGTIRRIQKAVRLAGDFDENGDLRPGVLPPNVFIEPVSSLKYFLPIIEETRHKPIANNPEMCKRYVEHVRNRIRRELAQSGGAS